MIIPFYKIIMVAVRVGTRPVIEYIKLYHKGNRIKSDRVRRIVINLGTRKHNFESSINKTYFKNKREPDPLNEDKAIELGIECCYETLFYCLMLTLPLSQILKFERDRKKSLE